MSEDEDDPPKPLRLGAGFWLWMAFGLVCVLGGLALARLGPLIDL